MGSAAFTKAMSGARLAACAIFLSGACVAPAFAQAPAPGQPSDALKAAFDALPEADRRAIQDALVWTGDYKGTIDGVLGRGGREAVVAYARRAKIAPESLLEDARRRQLLAEAQKLRAAARFATIQDARSGAAVAFPAAVFTRKTDLTAGARWTNAANSAAIETFRDAETDLAALYERLRAPAPARKVTYSVLRPDFLVVSGEDQRGMFYTRAARGEVNGRPVLRGYSLVYARALQPSFETFSIAISNGFQPFPAAVQGAPASSSSAPPAPAAPRRAVEATAIAVAPNRALAALSRDCPDMRVADRPAKIVRRDETSGLALIETQGLRAILAHPAVRAPGEADVFVLLATQAGARADVSLTPGRVLAPGASNGPWRASAAVQDGVGGAAVFDRSGSWMGVLAQPPQEPRRVAGVVPLSAWRIVPADAAVTFLASAGVKLEAGVVTTVEKSAGDIAAANAAAMLAVSCQR